MTLQEKIRKKAEGYGQLQSMEDIKLLYIDLFCGAGGTSTGVERARFHGKKCAKVIACVNHDANAIASHAANHPDAVHYTEDIRMLELSPMVEHLEKMRNRYPNAYVVLWASLECTNFSKAKGGLPRDADSRTLAEHLFRYIEAIEPDYIQIENVEEYMSWGDMDENGHPISKEKGKCYLRWIQNVKRYGYDYQYRILNSANYGAYTSRKRFFGQFAKHGLPIAFPVATHSKTGEKGLFGELKKWKPVRDVLDLSDEGESIFMRKKPLVEKTLERIYAGLVKFVAGMNQKEFAAFIVKYNSMNRSGHYTPPSIDEPCPTVACQNRLGVAQVHFLSKQFSGDPGSKNIGVDGPAGTLTCIDHHALVGVEFLQAYYGKGFEKDISKPCPTIPTKDRFGKVKTCFLDMQYGNGTPSSIDAPAPTATTKPKYQLVTAEQATQKWHYLMNPQFTSKGGSIEDPCFTLIARMDKMPPYLVSTEEGLGIEVYDRDSPMTKKIKEFMAMYNIIDIKMRMLKISELKCIMGFPADYILKGSQAEQKKYIGNAVEVGMARVLCEALCERLEEIERSVAV